MSEKQDTMQSEVQLRIYSLGETAKYARVTTDFILECERENLIEVTAVRGAIGYNQETVRRVIRIRHLHRDLGLDLTAIDCILRMRRRIVHLQEQIHDMERRMTARELELSAEIQRLRKQLALDSNWRSM